MDRSLVETSLREPWVQLQCLVIRGEGRFILARLRQRRTQHEVGWKMPGVMRQQACQLLDGFGMAAQSQQPGRASM